MLILSREEGEVIVIAGSIRITVVEIREGRVRLGVEAPQDVIVDREEVWYRRNREEPGRDGGKGEAS